VKYCGPGGGTVSVRARAVDDEIELTVQDSGIGIPRKDLDRIFERFYRVDGGRSRMSGGTGLGLSMVRHVVANHGGRVRVESAEGEGATFTIDLPAHPSPGSRRSPTDDDHPEIAPAADQEGGFADDDRPNRDHADDDRPNGDEVSNR
jgi:two-component system, OmpR family, sensor histidine kinase SenX3